MKEVDIEAEKRLLERLHHEMLVDHNTDIDEAMKHLAEDAILIPPNSPPIEGARAIIEVAKAMTGTEMDLGDRRGPDRMEISASGDLAYDIGRFRIVSKTPEGPVEEKGYFVTLYKKIDGQWKFMGQIWSNIK